MRRVAPHEEVVEMSRSMLRASALWGVLLASATVAASSEEAPPPPLAQPELAPPPVDASWEALAGDDGPDFVEGKKCECPGGCAMLKWMKSAMAGAVSSGDKDKIAKALEHIAGKPVAGYGEWASLAKQGAEAAKKGDIDAAKQSCKGCHEKYQKKYQDSDTRCKGW
jgi:hypothetical protein